MTRWTIALREAQGKKSQKYDRRITKAIQRVGALLSFYSLQPRASDADSNPTSLRVYKTRLGEFRITIPQRRSLPA